MKIRTMFQLIEDYHKVLGHNRPFDTFEQRMQAMRNNALALVMELAELVDSVPWKPWRHVSDQPEDKDNAVREVVDIIFFLVGICENLHITAEDIEIKFHEVIKNNYKRLDSGYSLKGGDAECGTGS